MIDPNSPREKLRESFRRADMEWLDDEDIVEFADMLIGKLLALHPTFAGVLDGTHVVVPKMATALMVAYARASLDAGHSPEILPREIWRVMVNAALDQEA